MHSVDVYVSNNVAWRDKYENGKNILFFVASGDSRKKIVERFKNMKNDSADDVCVDVTWTVSPVLSSYGRLG